MLYSIQEVANRLSVTRMTIYKKIESIKDFNKYIKVQEGVKYINDAGTEILRKSIRKLQTDSYNETISENNTISNLHDIHSGINDIQVDFIGNTKEDLDNDISALKIDFEKYTKLQNKLIENIDKQLELLSKDKEDLKRQLEAKDNQIESLTKLNENSQVLLSQAQQRIFLLESAKEKNPWWKRIFN